MEQEIRNHSPPLFIFMQAYLMIKKHKEVRENECGLLGSLTQEGEELF